MEIRVHGPGATQKAEPVAVTMRTPGHDFELAVGFCRTEGLLRRSDDLGRNWTDPQAANVKFPAASGAALKQISAQGSPDEQAIALRDGMRVLFPEAVALVSAARQGFMRER